MKKVIQFKKVLSGVDIFANIVTGLVALTGLITMAQVNLMLGLSFVLFAVLLWIFKIIGFGISYTLIQIAENTIPVVDDALVVTNIITTDLGKQFCSLYESNKGSDKVTDSMHRTYEKLQDGGKVRDIVLETAIEQLLS